MHEFPQARGNAYVAAARYESNAMRALQAGLGRQLGTEPPALYSYDPDTGRLAVTTPRYNTAIVAANHGAFPYGGVDLARLFNADQDVAGDLGGVGDGAFGLIVKDHGTAVLHTQYGRRTSSSPLTLVEPRRITAQDTALQAHAGPFTRLYVRGTVRQNGYTATSAYAFTPTTIEGHWGVSGPQERRGDRQLPQLGENRPDHRRRKAARRAAPKSGVNVIHIRSERSGYTVLPSKPATVRVVHPRPTGSNPDPGPSVEVQLGPSPARFVARIVVDT